MGTENKVQKMHFLSKIALPSSSLQLSAAEQYSPNYTLYNKKLTDL